VPAGLEIHAVLDNYATHKTDAVERWLRKHPCESGDELHDTFYLHHDPAKGYHIDYVFASEGMSGGVNVSVGTHVEWAKRSDHMPLICDFQ